jgi:carotenoid cleavage dioxygenase
MTTTERRAGTNDDAETYLYLEGNFAPVTEEVTCTELEVTGSIPKALVGRYLRTGPNPLDADAATYHWFAGEGMLHGVQLQNGDATWYRNRWVRCPEVVLAKGGSQVPRDDGGWYPGSGNTNVVAHAGSVWAITEGSLPYEIGSELETVRTSNFGGSLPAGWNAHPKFDPETGDLHVVSYGFDAPFIRYHVISAEGQITRTEEIDTQASVMVHDMGFSAERVAFFDLPVCFDIDAAMRGVSLPFIWNPEYRARVGVMAKSETAADTVWIDVDPCYVYHPLNAFDDGDTMVIDLVVHPRAFDDPARRDPGQGVPNLQRWWLNSANATWRSEVIDERGQEFPRADERLAGRPYRYGYSLGNTGFGSLGLTSKVSETGILKQDLVAGTTGTYDFGVGNLGSEFVFVPETPTSGEDEGWLMGYVYDGSRGASDLVILDAHDFGGAPVATVHLPVRVPQGFHGNWIPDRALN